MKKSINTLLKHSSFSKINRSANPAVVRASTILFNSMQELVSHEKKILKDLCFKSVFMDFFIIYVYLIDNLNII